MSDFEEKVKAVLSRLETATQDLADLASMSPESAAEIRRIYDGSVRKNPNIAESFVLHSHIEVLQDERHIVDDEQEFQNTLFFYQDRVQRDEEHNIHVLKSTVTMVVSIESEDVAVTQQHRELYGRHAQESPSISDQSPPNISS